MFVLSCTIWNNLLTCTVCVIDKKSGYSSAMTEEKGWGETPLHLPYSVPSHSHTGSVIICCSACGLRAIVLFARCRPTKAHYKTSFLKVIIQIISSYYYQAWIQGCWRRISNRYPNSIAYKRLDKFSLKCRHRSSCSPWHNHHAPCRQGLSKVAGFVYIMDKLHATGKQSGRSCGKVNQNAQFNLCSKVYSLSVLGSIRGR